MSDKALPKQIPIFPLTGAILLPTGVLPLNIFEPRYIEMVEHAHDNDQIIGMIQPSGSPVSYDTNNSDLYGTAKRGRDLYPIGCAGRICEMEKTDDNQYFIALEGICRFEVVNEIPMRHQFREVEASYKNYRHDGFESFSREPALRSSFQDILNTYLKHLKLNIDYQTFNDISDEEFVNSIAMICPFDASEKQLLLEAPTLKERTALMMKIMNFNLAKHDISSEDHLH